MSDEKRILLHFITKYFTKWGQNIVVSGAGPLFGDYDPRKAHWATCQHIGKDLVWEALVSIPLVPEITYKYAVVDDSMKVMKWEKNSHTLVLPPGLEDGSIVDISEEWMDDSHPANILSTRGFSDVIFPDRSTPTLGQIMHLHQVPPNEAIVRLQAWDWEIQDNQQIFLSGGAPQLGNWQMQQVLHMKQVLPGCWEAEVSIPLSAFPITYKYAIGVSGCELTLEHGESRIIALPMTDNNKSPALLVRNDGFFRRERRWRGAGVAVPVFSLRTRNSIGCGEFLDIVTVVNWCASVGLKLLQLLPIVDTSVGCTWRDSYPYSSLCVFALHPMYLSLRALVNKLPSEIEEEIEIARVELDLPEVDYEATLGTKLKISRKIFDLMGQKTLNSQGFKDFYEKSKEWLQPYAVFCFLRDLFGTAEHWRWGAMGTPTPEMLARLSAPHQEWHATIQYYYYLQYHLHEQLSASSKHAAASHVALKGDLPIGVDKRSVDTWLAPKQFRMNTSTGAPPDYFDPGGQNWGFPTYNWEEMEKDGYSWWKRRLAHMEQYFHAYRIDHILGFFRIWELPGDSKSGLLGRFRPSVPLWRHELESRGIWDIDRLCDPYVTLDVLERTFGEGDLAQEIAARYFVQGPGNRLKFRPEFESEQALSALQPRANISPEMAEEVNITRRGLISLRQNVILLRDPEDPERLYPRIGFSKTSSFKALDLQWREELLKLHDDYFHNRSESLWRSHALKTLPVLQSASKMLVCGEDLGMLDPCVHPVMEELGIIGLRIQRMPSEVGVEFGDPANYPYMTVASPSSHDTTTLREWYRSDPERRERFFKDLVLKEDENSDGPADALIANGFDDVEVPEECVPDVAKVVIEQHLRSPSVLAIFPLQDLMALSGALATRPPEEETINDPTNSEHYWRYRMHVQVEEVAADRMLNDTLKGLLLLTGRL